MPQQFEACLSDPFRSGCNTPIRPADLRTSQENFLLLQTHPCRRSLILMGSIEGIVTRSSNPQLEEIITEDGILCNILSFLNLREAVRTSVLSSRWRYLWTRRTNFYFDSLAQVNKYPLQGHLRTPTETHIMTEGDPTRFIPLVNSVLHQLQGARLDGFGVCYHLDASHSQYLDEWVRFAVESGVKSLLFFLIGPWDSPLYGFPWHLLQSSTSIETLSLMMCSLKLRSKCDGLRHLRELSLAVVDVNDEDLRWVVSSCCLSLTYLTLFKVDGLTSISSLHPLNQLKNLDLQDCCQLRKIDLNAKNLVKLVYQGVLIELKFGQSSKLIEADILFETEGTMYSLDSYITSLSSSLPHLRYLTFKLTSLWEVTKVPKVSSKFIHLTHMDWDWDTGVTMSLLHLSALLDVAPLLETLILRLSAHIKEQPHQTTRDSTEMLPRHPLKHLKVIEIIAFYFETWQIEIVEYLLHNAMALKSMVIEKGSNPSRIVSEEIHEKGMKSIKQEVPKGVKLVIT